MINSHRIKGSAQPQREYDTCDLQMNNRRNLYVKDLRKSAFLVSLLLIQTNPLSYAQQAASQPASQSASQTANPSAASPAKAPETLKLAEGTDVPLAFDQDLSSKTAAEGDPVAFVLTDDIKVGDVVVAKAGSKAFGEVSHAEHSGMMGKAGTLSIRLDYLKVGDAKVKLRGTKGKEGENATTATVALTVLFGPIGLIKHGKNIEIKKGTALKAYVGDDVTLPPVV